LSGQIVEDNTTRATARLPGCIDDIVSPKTFNIADDWNGSLLDPAGQLFGHASLCLALTDTSPFMPKFEFESVPF